MYTRTELPVDKEEIATPDKIKQLDYLKVIWYHTDWWYQSWPFNWLKLREGIRVLGGNTRSPGKTCFIPHHGVYHPNKPGKIRVVFDCSAEFDEQSLNKELLTGPDLTNQILGVLTRFWQNSIAFMADIEAMYYQLVVPEHQQTFIKFLWWNDHNIDEDPVYFAMCVHVFWGAFSASSANYAYEEHLLTMFRSLEKKQLM